MLVVVNILVLFAPAEVQHEDEWRFTVEPHHKVLRGNVAVDVSMLVKDL